VIKKRPITAETIETILLFSIVIVLSFFTYYMTGTLSRNQPTEIIYVNGEQSNSTETMVIENKKLEEAIQELKMEGCQIVFVEPKIYLDYPNYVDYGDFFSKAIERKLVIVTPGESGMILVVQLQKTKWVWIPS
jgi:hypothetical protein